MGYVYKITNTVNGKAYIGISIHEPTNGRIKEHLAGRGNRYLANVVKKYGKDAFTYDILEANVFDELLPDLEVAYIAKFNTVRPHGFNLTYGGEICKKVSEETRQKISEALRGENNAFFGKRPSAETRQKISEANKGKKRSPAVVQKMSERAKGKRHSAETRQKISELMKGRKRTKEHQQKLAESRAHPDRKLARSYFFLLPSDMPLKEKRQLLFSKFPSVPRSAIYSWVQKWVSTP